MLSEINVEKLPKAINFNATMEEVVVIDNYIPNAIQTYIWNIINSHAWLFGHTTAGEWNPWIYDQNMAEVPALKQHIFPEASPVSNDNVWQVIFGMILDLLPQKVQLHNILINGQQFIHDTLIHTDTKNWPSQNKMDGITVLYYANPEWREEWGGYTQVNTPDDIYRIAPKPGRLCIFNSNMPHKGYPPNEIYKNLRVTVAFKVFIQK